MTATLSGTTATGFVFDDATLAALKRAIDRALKLYNQTLTWRRLQRQAMSQEFGWGTSAAKYAMLYREILGIGRQADISPVPSIEMK